MIASKKICLRWGAFSQLAKTWPDQTTRDLLTQYATQDENSLIRCLLLLLHTGVWPDQTTRDLLVQRIAQDPDVNPRGAAFSMLGMLHSEFGHILLTQKIDGSWPYLDPLEPIPRQHIEKAAQEAGIHPDEIDAQVASLSAHMGWDITAGAKAEGIEQSQFEKTKIDRWLGLDR